MLVQGRTPRVLVARSSSSSPVALKLTSTLPSPMARASNQKTRDAPAASVRASSCSRASSSSGPLTWGASEKESGRSVVFVTSRGTCIRSPGAQARCHEGSMSRGVASSTRRSAAA